MLLGVGEYKSFDLIKMQLPTKALSSVALPPGLRLTLFNQDDFRGSSINLTESVSCLEQRRCVADPEV